MPDIVFGDRYRLGRRIRENVYLGTETISSEKVIIELRHAKDRPLSSEADVYRGLIGEPEIPIVWWFSKRENYNGVIINIHGADLNDLFTICGRKFSLKTVLLLADQLISLIEYIHGESVVYRAITPQNFLMGLEEGANQVYIIDFSLAKNYRDPKTHIHIPVREDKKLVGNAYYCSINTHHGFEQSCRDDLESLFYMLINFLRGSLPWSTLSADTEEFYNRIGEKKENTLVEDLCQGLPDTFATALKYIRSLAFDEKPNYSHLREILRDLFRLRSFQDDYIFDWTGLRRIDLSHASHKNNYIEPNSAYVEPIADETSGIVLQLKTSVTTAE